MTAKSGRCRACGCSEFDACEQGCSWTDAECTLCDVCMKCDAHSLPRSLRAALLSVADKVEWPGCFCAVHLGPLARPDTTQRLQGLGLVRTRWVGQHKVYHFTRKGRLVMRQLLSRSHRDQEAALVRDIAREGRRA